MYRKILIGGATVAVVACAGGVAAATTTGSSSTPGSGSSSASSSGSSSSSSKGSGSKGSSSKGSGSKGKKHHNMLRHVDHGSFVTGKQGKFVTHQIIRGTVSAVSSTSITVTAADKTSETFTVTKDTKVRHRTAGVKAKPTTSSIGDVSKGDDATVTGTGTTTKTAKHIADVTKK